MAIYNFPRRESTVFVNYTPRTDARLAFAVFVEQKDKVADERQCSLQGAKRH